MFTIIDDDGDRKISMNELQKALHNFGVPLASDSDLQNLFARFDRDNSGTIDFDEFLQALRVCFSLN
jgi:Ca2+-binding EF-hand superfamily protein